MSLTHLNHKLTKRQNPDPAPPHPHGAAFNGSLLAGFCGLVSANTDRAKPAMSLQHISVAQNQPAAFQDSKLSAIRFQLHRDVLLDFPKEKREASLLKRAVQAFRTFTSSEGPSKELCLKLSGRPHIWSLGCQWHMQQQMEK